MTAASSILLALALACAVGDWIAVARGAKRFEYIFKPATLLGLIGVAVTLDSPDVMVQWWFVAALALSLLGDVFLMLPNDPFVPGLASFLFAHIAYIVGLSLEFESALALWGAVAGLLVGGVVVGRPIVAGLVGDKPALRGPVVIYMAAISAMVMVAVASLQLAAVIGALLFYCSDAQIGWTRFVRPIHGGPLAIIVTYHLGQTGLVLSLLE